MMKYVIIAFQIFNPTHLQNLLICFTLWGANRNAYESTNWKPAQIPTRKL